MAELDHDAFMTHALLWAANAESPSSPELEVEDENGLTLMEVAETNILAHPPENHAQIIVQLELICQDLAAGGVRDDGLDVRALRNIQRALFAQSLATDGDLGRFAAIRSASKGLAESARKGPPGASFN
jgi:hypothetical protein